MDRIRVVQSSLDNIKVDAIVNTTGWNLSLNSGYVSKNLLAKAGDNLQKECTFKCPKGIHFGEIVHTSGYQLDCKYVLHAALDAYNDKDKAKCLQNLQKLVFNCMRRMVSLKCKTIAFPAIGTGNLGYPKDKVATVMFIAVDQFMTVYPDSGVQDVMFVVYAGDKYTVQAFENVERQKAAGAFKRAAPLAGFSKDLHIGRMTISAECGTLAAARAQSVIYLWEKQNIYTVPFDSNVLLKQLDSAARRQFTDHRNDKYKRFEVLTTGGGRLPHIQMVIHVPCDDAPGDIIRAFKAGLTMAETKNLISAVILFPAAHPLLKYGDKLAHGLIEAVKDVTSKPELLSLTEVCLLIEGETNFSRIRDYIDSSDSNSRPGLSTSLKTNASVKVKFTGLKHNVEKASAELSEQLKRAQVGGDRGRLSPVEADAAITCAPTAQVMDRGGEYQGLITVDASSNKNVPSREEDRGEPAIYKYVMVANIPQGTTETQLISDLLTQQFPVRPPTIVYPGGTQALLICQSSKDAMTLDGYQIKGASHQYTFSKHKPPVLKNFTTNLAVNIVNAAKKKGILDDLTNKLEAIDVSIQCDSKDTVQLITNTTIQFEKSKQIIETFAEHIKLKIPRQKTGTCSGFVDIDAVDCSSIAWDACQIVMYDLVQQLKKGPTGLSYGNGKLMFDHGTAGCSDKDQTLISQLRDFLSKDFDEIPVEDTGKDVDSWCRDIGTAVGVDCCVYIRNRHTVITYTDKYETIQKIRHQLNLKQGNVKQTGRGRQTRDLVASDDQMRELASPESPPIRGAEQQTEMMVSHTRGSTTGFAWRRDAVKVKTYPTSEGVLVKVYVANILKLPVDCIVNAANGSLQHGGGVARVIAEAAGYNLTRDCNDYARKTGDVPVGMAYTSTAGNLSYNCVIHTVGPCWTDYQPHSLKKVQKCEDDLFNAILNSFYEAEKRGLKSIALPAISSAIFRVPQEICAYQYAKATVHYSKGSVHSHNALQEIHFIDKNEDIVRKIQRSFKDMFQDRKLDPPYDIHDFVNRRSRSPYKQPPVTSVSYTNEQSSKESGTSRAFHGGKRQTGPTSYEDKSTGVYTFHMMGDKNQTLKLYMADIVRVDVPAIVCSDDARGSGQGFIARELEKHGKLTRYESDKKEQFAKYNSSKGKKVDGDVVVSDGFSNFKRIFHAILPSYVTTLDAATVTPTLKKAYSNVLQKCADNKKLYAIAMPLLATGRASKDKLETSAKAFLDSYLVFCNKMKDKQQTLTVHLVCHELSKMQVVNRVLYAHVQTKSGSPPQRPLPPASAVPPKASTHWPSAQPTAYPYASKVNPTWPPAQSTVYPSLSKVDPNWPPVSESNTAPPRPKEQPTGYRPRNPPAADYNPPSSPTTGDTTGDAKSSKVPDNSQKGDSSDNDNCVICMDPMTNPKSLKCGHKFCTDCIDESFKHKKTCPMCGAVCGIITGDQPYGTVNVYLSKYEHCAGYQTVGQWQITYNFPDGHQEDNHPSPGQRYRGIRRTGFLPDNKKGRLICEMLQVAFKRKLVFTIGDSRTTGHQGVITWNDIHHKTDPTAGTAFGYPDADYLGRVIEELAAKGVTQADVPKEFHM